ncbi:MAG: phosphoribosylanthranilate isomerase [Planctomycetota bacterium]
MTVSSESAVSRHDSTRPFRIKVCGVRRPEDLDACVEAGVDCVGLNLYPPSVRYMDPDGTELPRLAANARERGLMTVGVFVNESLSQIERLADSLELDAVQLHGEESPQQAALLTSTGIAVLRAIRLPSGPLEAAQIQHLVEPWIDVADAVLLDADAGGGFGGSGQRLDWSSIARWHESAVLDGFPWILAGGLSPTNVADAITVSGAASVDVASGTESPRGVKSAERIGQFASEALAAWRL